MNSSNNGSFVRLGFGISSSFVVFRSGFGFEAFEGSAEGGADPKRPEKKEVDVPLGLAEEGRGLA